MFAVVSPAKKLDFKEDGRGLPLTQPAFMADTEELSGVTRKLTRADLRQLMGISEKLADLNYERFQAFSTPFTPDNSKAAALAFSGDTYVGLDAAGLDDADLDHAQNTLGILSGFYGLLRPLDMIQPYRLEMGIKLANPRAADLYGFWGDSLAVRINDITQGHKDRTLVNLASNEYFDSVNTKLLDGPVLTPVFKEVKNGVAKVVSFSAKRARGMMARYMIENRLEEPSGLKDFGVAGYAFQEALSDDTHWVFTRDVS